MLHLISKQGIEEKKSSLFDLESDPNPVLYFPLSSFRLWAGSLSH